MKPENGPDDGACSTATVTAKRDDSQAIVRPHRLVQKVEDFLLSRRAAGRHGLAAVGNDDEGARLARQTQHHAAQGQQQQQQR